ncbi:MAG: aminopeptidase P family protein [Rhodospirillaceae bacterium]|nr:aminopeptidase P family protein [Rhodospirillaceae bacterium]MYH37835.1 aminopeptidase P family protein [Rhodospirillaceae bacterium]MYK16058.1 aminopeptidase P family protein [Rhodospirillaceae bacterium]MYK58018.1 aminopeptidase P family protein [Rhodospirillaceae bacterium]
MNEAADYRKAFAARPQPLTLEQAARITPPARVTDTEGLLDVPRMRAWRQNRLREQIAAHGLDAVVLVEPLSIRYAAGVRNCALFQMHIQAGYLFVPADGPVVYFDSEPGRHTGRQLETIDEVRDDLLPLSYMFAGSRQRETARKWAAQMGDLLNEHCGGGARVAVDRIGRRAVQALIENGFAPADAAPVLAHARRIKCPEEILAMNLALAAAEDGMTRMRDALRPGIAEQELWALMWQATIEHGGEWLDYRLLASGERTNPWQQEASGRTIRSGDLVVFDCGMVGPLSYGADVSRAFHCGPGRPGDEQRKLYTLAWNEVTHNTELLRAGTSFRDFIAARYIQEPGYGDQPYPCLAHGVGMGDEWPVIHHSPEHDDHYDGAFEAGMVICVESYVGKVGGVEGVKLEDQVLVTESGPIVLSRYPYEDSLLGREV